MSTPVPSVLVDAYGGGGFRIGGERIEGSILLLDGVARPWPVASLAALRPHDLGEVAGRGPLEVEVLLLGAGPAMALAPRSVRDAMMSAGVGLDVMSTPEACRLYNYLLGEGRRVAAALIAI